MAEENRIAELEAMLDQVKRSAAGSDRMVNQLKQKLADAEARLLRGGSEAAILARIDNLQAEYRKKDRQRELEYFKKVRCLDAGVPFDLLADIPFDSETAIERKVGQLAEAVAIKAQDGVEARLSAMPKPAAGVASKVEPFSERVQKELREVSYG